MILAPVIVDALTGRTTRPPLLAHLPDATKLAVPMLIRVVSAALDAGGTWRDAQKVLTPHLAGLVDQDALAVIPPRSHAPTPVEINGTLIEKRRRIFTTLPQASHNEKPDRAVPGMTASNCNTSPTLRETV